MLRYYLYLFAGKLNSGKYRLFFNTSFLSFKKRVAILKKSGMKVEKGATITTPFYFEFGQIELHENVLINSGCTFLDNEKIIVMKNAMIGPNVTISTVSHYVTPSERHAGNITAPITIGENVWLGAGCVICPGVTIGNNSVIAANSVVTSNVPDNVLFAGSPASLKKRLGSA